MSRAYAEVIGDPISHSKSPLIHNFWLKKLGIDAEYLACHVRPGELEDYFTRRRGDADWQGCNVTIPHKESVARLVDEADARASGIGALNAVVKREENRLWGLNTDVDGIAAAIAGTGLAGCDAVVIGAGGAARAAFAFLAGKGCASVRSLARTPDKAIRAASASGLATEAWQFGEASGAAFGGATLLINATQLGMTGQEPMPQFVIDGLAIMANGALVFDMVYAPIDTALLSAARERSMRTSDGLVMLVGQAATAFEHFFCQPAPREHDTELRKQLSA